MIEKILVATDGSSHAAKAVDLAASLAAQYGAKLKIVHVLMHGRPPEELQRMAEVENLVRHVQSTMPAMDNVPATMAGIFHETESASRTGEIVAAIGDKLLDGAATAAREAGATDVETEVLTGDYADQIIKAAEKDGADMIVMGSRGLGDLKGLLVGSVSHKVSQHAKCTVVSVK